MYTDLDKSKIYEGSNIAISLEFNSPVRRRDMASKLSKNLGKKVKWFKGVDESFKPSGETFKLSNRYSETSKMFVFETGFMQYQDAIHTMLKAMNIIDHFGYTDDRCEAKVKINIDPNVFESKTHISKLNRFKYLIGLNEEDILKEWNTNSNERFKLNENQYLHIHAKNPYYTVISSSLLERVDPYAFSFPHSDFFGHDFSNIGEGYITINYIGGKNYINKKNEAVSTINTVINRLYETLDSNYTYSVDEKRKIEKMVSNYRKTVESTKTYTSLKSNYPDINIYFDLKTTPYLLESNYVNFREKIFELLVFGGMTEGDINWDNDRKIIQVKDANIDKNIVIENFEFYNCVIEADAKNCLFNSCTIKNSKLQNCDIASSNYIKKSKVFECKYHDTNNKTVASHISSNPKDMISGEIKNCIVSKGNLHINSEVDTDTIFVNK